MTSIFGLLLDEYRDNKYRDIKTLSVDPLFGSTSMHTFRTRLASALLISLAMPAAVIAGAPAADQAASVEPAEATPSVVLVHGAFADGSSWNKVIPLLQARGLKVVAVQNPLTSLEDDVEAANRIIDAQDGPVVLVGHSWGGSVITQAGGSDKVKALVYVAAFAPSLGQAPVVDLQAYPTPSGASHFIQDKHGFLTLSPQSIASEFAQDVSAEEASLIAATQGPVRGANFEQRVTVAAWTTKPSWYIVADQDRMIHPDAQRGLARKIDAKVVTLPTSHVPMVSDPQAVADVIAEAAEAIR
ncbi:alpha/beta fold hydrolase [Luteimonas sp. RIT-PG2_3]